MTIRDYIHEIQKEVKDTDLQPERAAELLTKLAALIGNVNDEIRKRDIAYQYKLLEMLAGKSVAAAKIHAQTSDEYVLMREARDMKELALELIRSLKYFLKAKQEEWSVSKDM